MGSPFDNLKGPTFLERPRHSRLTCAYCNAHGSRCTDSILQAKGGCRLPHKKARPGALSFSFKGPPLIGFYDDFTYNTKIITNPNFLRAKNVYLGIPGLLYCSLNVVVQLIDTIMWVSSLYARYFLVTTQE